jgi:membrane associated rhomboid family serine protease
MTIYVIAITVIISLIAFNNEPFKHKLIHNPYLTKHHKQWYRLVSNGFLHADFMHLLVNMFVLYSFGMAVEQYYLLAFGKLGSYIYTLLYISAIFASSISTQYKYQDIEQYNSLGASGAVSAILFTAILFNPYNPLYFYGIIAIPGIVFGLLYLGYSFYMSKKQSDHVNHDAHFYGALYGILFTIFLKPQIALVFINQLLGR